jgi:hypothetical protein
MNPAAALAFAELVGTLAIPVALAIVALLFWRAMRSDR